MLGVEAAEVLVGVDQLSLLHVVEMEIVDAVHFNTIGRTLKKTLSNRT